MTYTNLKKILSSVDAKKVFGIQLVSGEELQFARQPRRDADENKYHTVWKLNDTLQCLAVRSAIATVSGITPIVMSYYPAESIESVQLFLTDTQIAEDKAFNTSESSNEVPDTTFTDPIA